MKKGEPLAEMRFHGIAVLAVESGSFVLECINSPISRRGTLLIQIEGSEFKRKVRLGTQLTLYYSLIVAQEAILNF
ncbi:MAG: hypothetical protein K2K95_11355, partial [Muribaculaceae bacterium]|nr:hypothetical protein [Muribaculaceae bacterium]